MLKVVKSTNKLISMDLVEHSQNIVINILETVLL